MPTARELLEQADALMRRNRAAAADDIPVLTDSVALPAGMPSAAAATPVFPEVVAPQPRGEEHVPTLTEAVAVTGDESGDSVIQEGEPSDWLHFDREGPSIIGGAPDSIAIVPQVARPPAPARDADAIASAELEEIELTTPAEEAFDDEFGPADTNAEVDAMPPEVAPVTAVEPATPASAPTDAWFSSWSSAAGTPPPPIEALVPPMPAPPDAVPADAAAIEIAADSAPSVPPLPSGGFAAATATAATVGATDDVAKWDAIAEEVRMQVLQRIDLFTDTGLREQLAMHLQPIVDRASADLVATINLRVGELLRAYVAEAIEREIENWRSTH